MSILLGPYDKDSSPIKTEEQLLVFGYACKLYRDDVKAALESSGQLLIPWMGDNSLMVDRYDVRNRLDDKSQFGVKSNLPYKISAEEESFEDFLDSERYLALHWDDIRVEEQEEEERRRAMEHSFHAIDFSYNNEEEAETEPSQEAPSFVSLPQPQKIEHPPSCSVDIGDEDAFVLPKDLVVPEGIKLPSSAKLHSIIDKTAMFVCQQGQPMEIIIKAKQKFNPFFSFLNMSDALYPFYSHIKTLISMGSYVPLKETVEVDREAVSPSDKNASETNISQPKENEDQQTSEEHDGAGSENLTHRTEEFSESGSEDEGEYLHPLLANALNRKSKSSTPTPLSHSSKEATPPVNLNGTQDKEDKMSTAVASVYFRAQSMAVNAAPVLKPPAENGLGSGRQSTLIVHASDPKQFYSSYPYPEGQSTPGYYGYTHPSPCHDVGGHHQAPLPPHVHESHLPGGPLPPHAHETHHPHLPSDLLPPHAYKSHYLPLSGDPHKGHYPPHSGGHPGYYDYEAYYNTLSAIHIQNLHNEATPHTLPAPPPDLQSIINKMVEYVIKNGDNFESTVLKRHAGDSRFSFLNPWDEHHAYYIQQKTRCQEKTHVDPTNQIPKEDSPQIVTLSVEKINLQKLNSSGAVSFKLQPKSVNLAVSSTDIEQFTADDDDVEEVAVHEDWQETEEFEPQAKKPRLDDNGSGEPDQIGSRVQEFLSTMKAMCELPNPNQSDT